MDSSCSSTGLPSHPLYLTCTEPLGRGRGLLSKDTPIKSAPPPLQTIRLCQDVMIHTCHCCSLHSSAPFMVRNSGGALGIHLGLAERQALMAWRGLCSLPSLLKQRCTHSKQLGEMHFKDEGLVLPGSWHHSSSKAPCRGEGREDWSNWLASRDWILCPWAIAWVLSWAASCFCLHNPSLQFPQLCCPDTVQVGPTVL